MIELKPYRPALRKDLTELWNAVFAGRRHFLTLDRDLFRRRIECPAGKAIDPRFLQVATDGNQVLGFAHAGLWDARLGAQMLPDREASGPVGYLGVVVVGNAHRRHGIGRRLVAAVGEVVREVGGPQTPLVADGRMFNPHYGNFLAPLPPLWGTTEGIAVPHEDAGTRAFLVAVGFRECTPAWSFTVDPATVADLTIPPPAAGPPELVEAENYLPELGTRDGIAFAAPNASRTWVLVVNDLQVGYLIAYPLGDGPDAPWAIYSLELAAEVRGQGLGPWLTARVLADLAARGVPEVETLVLPEEAPEALRLYQRFGFQKQAAWVIFQ